MARRWMMAVGLVAVVGLGDAGPAGATAVVAATEPTQVQNNLQLIAQVQAQISTVAQLVSQLNHMREQAQSLASGGGFLQTVSTVNGIATSVHDFQQSTFQAASMVDEFHRTHPGVQLPTNYTQQYNALRDMNRNSVETALRSIGLQADQVGSIDQVVTQLRNNANNAQSQRAATDAGNQLLVAILEQLRLLNQTQREMLRVMALASSTADQRAGYGDAVVRDRFQRSDHPMAPGRTWENSMNEGAWAR